MKEQLNIFTTIVQEKSTLQPTFFDEFWHLRSILERFRPSCPCCGNKMMAGCCGVLTCSCSQEGLGKILMNLTQSPIRGYTAIGIQLPLSV